MPSQLFDDRYGALVLLLVETRHEAGLTQVELGHRMRKLQSFISKAERRERRIDPVELYDWAKALQIDPVELFRRLVEQLEGT